MTVFPTCEKADDWPRSLLSDPWAGRLLRYYPDDGLVMSAGRDYTPPFFEDHPWRTRVAWQMKPFYDKNKAGQAFCCTTPDC